MAPPLRRTPARVAFLQVLHDQGTTTSFPADMPLPTVASIRLLRQHALVTASETKHRRAKHGGAACSLMFTITDAGRAWLRATTQASSHTRRRESSAPTKTAE